MYMQKIEERINLLLKKCEALGIESSQELKRAASRIFPLERKELKELRMACIADRFTLDSYRPECNLLELSPDAWHQELESFSADIVFIESAWEGKDKLWYRKIANGSKELYELCTYCHEKKIPVIFWNKEDPVYTDTFMSAAQLADFVFTTDIDCIPIYKANLMHDRVFHLHFAAQPALHNPVEKFSRKDKFCFAGAYYHRYPKRTQVFDAFAEVFIDGKGFDIFDRNYKNNRPEHAFPAKYSSFILGNLDPSQIDVAYKGYEYGVNMNSIDQSQTMFARRVFEMLASNTVTVGNYSRGVKNYFGDLTICTNDKVYLDSCLREYCADTNTLAKYKLAGLRKVLSQHLYEDRLDYVVSKVFGKSLKRSLPSVAMFAYVANEAEAKRVVEMFVVQQYADKKLYLFGKGAFEAPERKIFVWKESDSLSQFSEDIYVGFMDSRSYYGNYYLTDLILTLRYYSCDGMGKGEYYSYESSGFVRNGEAKAYRASDSLCLMRSLVKSQLLSSMDVKTLWEANVIHGKFFCTDIFNYCTDFTGDSCEWVDELRIPDQGLGMHSIEELAESISIPRVNYDCLQLMSKDIAALALNTVQNKVQTKQEGEMFLISSHLPPDEHTYIYINRFYPVSQFAKEGKLTIQFKGIGDLDTIGSCLFFDQKEKPLPNCFGNPNCMLSFDVPAGAVSFKLALRIKGPGSFHIHGIYTGEDVTRPLSTLVSRSRTLVLTNVYPQSDNLYRNMFVHQRVRSYKQQGCLCDVMCMNIYAKDQKREFEGINIIEGQSAMLESILSSGQIDTVCVHFLDPIMWETLQRFGKQIRILVWLHGAEIQPWWRREYNYESKKDLEKAKQASEIRLKFWQEVFSKADDMNIHFIFVSKYFADEVCEDNQVSLSPEKMSIIHNAINTSLFRYIPKTEEQRKKLLSIRPYASNKYANDLTVKCIMELSKRPYFNELEICLIGSGELFDDTLRPLKKFKNVKLEKRFLTQDQIAQIHLNYGVFLTPTRMDAQGVSRDEAMSSGMVPVTNAVTAIPEFADESCAVLAPAEDYMAMAEGIEKLYYNPDFFLRLSENAAKRVRSQTAPEFTIMKEVELIYGER